ncbi:MAG: hypothetical protein AAF528_00915 [Cyanobacteria bacterium P01_C01_bin.121]
MSLPVVLEIAIGLLFIYLTLSLIASEIQEILSALFQWRAEHLKRSIEQLLAGDISTSSTAQQRQQNHAGIVPSTLSQKNHQAAKEFADRLYASPLIENLNYEAQGGVSGLFRTVLHGMGKAYRLITFSRNVFGQKTSGPSYIPAETFATSLIERLQLKDFQQLLIRSRFNEFLNSEVRLPLHNTVNELRARLENEELMAAEILYCDQSLDQIAVNLDMQRISLSSALAQVIDQLQAFETMATDTPLIEMGADPALIKSFLGRIRYLRTGLSGHTHQNESLIARLKPSLGDLTALLDPNSPTYNELVALAQKEGEAVHTLLEKLHQEVVPPRLRESLSTLARRAEANVDKASSEIYQLQVEIESWFNHGMERASGVYRRNVKGVGILIGLAIAFTINADTFYMFQRLSSDQAIRSSIIQTAEQLDVQTLSSAAELSEEFSFDQLSEQLKGDLRSVGIAVEDALADYPLPIGRSQAIIAAQEDAESAWPVPLIPQRFVGWAITALALSMGASFWFDLLRKVMSVRSSGSKPS